MQLVQHAAHVFNEAFTSQEVVEMKAEQNFEHGRKMFEQLFVVVHQLMDPDHGKKKKDPEQSN